MMLKAMIISITWFMVQRFIIYTKEKLDMVGLVRVKIKIISETA